MTPAPASGLSAPTGQPPVPGIDRRAYLAPACLGASRGWLIDRSEVVRRAERAMDAGSADAMLLSLNDAHGLRAAGTALVLVEVESGALDALADRLAPLLGPLLYSENPVNRPTERVVTSYCVADTLHLPFKSVADGGAARTGADTSPGAVRR